MLTVYPNILLEPLLCNVRSLVKSHVFSLSSYPNYDNVLNSAQDVLNSFTNKRIRRIKYDVFFFYILKNTITLMKVNFVIYCINKIINTIYKQMVK